MHDAMIELDVMMSGLLVLGGVFAGYVNAVAGGGSALTLPLFMLFGMDAAVANGTNRVSVGVQAVTAAASFHHQRIRPWSAFVKCSGWVLIGAIAGVFVAIRIPPSSLEVIFGIVFMVLAVVIARGHRLLEPRPADEQIRPSVRLLGYLLVGFYGGVFQAGVGIPLLLALIYFDHLDVARANAVKAMVIAIYTAIILVVFDQAGQVAWTYGLLVGAGGIFGSILGARAVIKRGAGLVRVVVVVALVLSSMRSLWSIWV